MLKLWFGFQDGGGTSDGPCQRRVGQPLGKFAEGVRSVHFPRSSIGYACALPFVQMPTLQVHADGRTPADPHSVDFRDPGDSFSSMLLQWNGNVLGFRIHPIVNQRLFEIDYQTLPTFRAGMLKGRSLPHRKSERSKDGYRARAGRRQIQNSEWLLRAGEVNSGRFCAAPAQLCQKSR
jgi:hypothetical protein